MLMCFKITLSIFVLFNVIVNCVLNKSLGSYFAFYMRIYVVENFSLQAIEENSKLAKKPPASKMHLQMLELYLAF